MDGEVYELILRSAQEHGVLPLTSVCNVSCIFCSNRQNPNEIRTYNIDTLSLQQVKEVVAYMQPHARIIIGESATRINEGEPLTHPNFISVLEIIRSKFPDVTIQITTNGNLLSVGLVKQLSMLGLIEIYLSINSASAEGRFRLMNDRDAEKAVQVPRLLCEYEIPYHGSLVAQPSVTGWSDIERTIGLLAECSAKTVRIFMPGYTRWYQGETLEKLTADLLTTYARKMTLRYSIPVLAEPPALSDLDAVVEGIIKGSPAEYCDILPGQIIRQVNDIKVLSRHHAYNLCRDAESPLLSITGEHKKFEKKLHKRAGESSGLVFYQDIDPQRMDCVRSQLSALRDRILILTSVLAKPTITKACSQFIPELSDLQVIAVENRFFGGTIVTAGLLTVEDFLVTIQNLDTRKSDIHTILIPREPFDHKGFDLVGRSYREIEEKTSCRVILV